MMLFKEIINEIDLEDYLMVVLVPRQYDDRSQLLTEGVLQEGIWKHDNATKFDYRVDTPQVGDRHIQIAHEKHHAAKNKQVSWNVTGTRHDNYSFDQNFKGMNKAKELAKRVLKLGDDIVLEALTPQAASESMRRTDLRTDLQIIVLEARKKENSIISKMLNG